MSDSDYNNGFPAYPANETGIDGFETSIGFTPVTWPENTTVQLCNVPWDANYRDVVKFADTATRDSYFTSMLDASKIVLNSLTYCKVGEPVRIDVPYSAAYKYNYLVVTNPSLPVPGEVTPPKLFYFITGVQFISPNTTGLYLQLDVWTTYHLDMALGRCFVERGHAALHAYTNSSLTMAQKKRRYLTAPEGLDCGTAYIINNENAYSAGGGSAADVAHLNNSDQWNIIIVSAVELDGDFGTVNNPKLKASGGALVDGLVSGCKVYALKPSAFGGFMETCRDYPWISNQILSITAMPAGAVDLGTSVTINGSITAYKCSGQRKYIGGAGSSLWNIASLDTFLKSNTNTRWQYHPKARVYPFSYVKCDNQINEPLMLMPELFASDSVDFTRLDCVLPPFQCMRLFPQFYGLTSNSSHNPTCKWTPDNGNMSQTVPKGEKFDNALNWTDFPQFSITNDGYLMYLASNANSLKYQRNNAGWGLDKSLASANVSYDNAQRSLDAATENQREAYNMQKDISRYNMGNLVQNSLRDTYNNLDANVRAGASKIFGTNIDRVINTTVNAANGSMANELGNTQFQNTRQAQQGNIDANYKLQKWAAKGDYQQSIAAIDATVRDARLNAPTQSGTFGGGFYAVLAGKGLAYWFLQSMTVSPGVQSRIASYWDRFGYAIGEYMTVSRILLNKRFTYWKMQDTTLSHATADEGCKEILRGIFEKGVTIWDKPADIAASPSTTFTDNAPITSTPLY